MEVLEIPFQTNTPHTTQQTELDGKTYTLEFEFIERESFWMLHIGDQDGNPLVCGIKLVADWPLPRRDAGVTGGELVQLCNEMSKNVFWIDDPIRFGNNSPQRQSPGCVDRRNRLAIFLGVLFMKKYLFIASLLVASTKPALAVNRETVISGAVGAAVSVLCVLHPPLSAAVLLASGQCAAGLVVFTQGVVSVGSGLLTGMLTHVLVSGPRPGGGGYHGADDAGIVEWDD